MHNEPDRIRVNAAVQAGACLAGQPLGSIDIVNSQPALLALFIHNTVPSIYDRHTFTSEVGFSQYEQLATSGRLYEHLVDRTGLSRREVKKGRSLEGARPGTTTSRQSHRLERMESVAVLTLTHDRHRA
jgi:hypothetical protein